MSQHGAVGGVSDGDFALAYTYGLDENDVEAERVQNPDRRGSGFSESAEVSPGSHRANEYAGIACYNGHADSVAEYRSACERARWINGKYSHRATGLPPNSDHGCDESRLSDAWRAGDADDDGAAGVRCRRRSKTRP
ncbi:hypothetical protein GCM10009858_02260 [Terrabacter carboxydivorans]|uniref:Uncharacterized protein n=1 Tax=Terrabacter carboxydivorans TaxID=619730 RepID=A0ABN3KP57_9MICO